MAALCAQLLENVPGIVLNRAEKRLRLRQEDNVGEERGGLGQRGEGWEG